MKIWADMHIHSCLSPCADDEMTPNNIIGMAVLKGLDMIAVTDHNTAGNLPAVMAAAEGTGLIVVPGMELTTKEEVHVLAYFSSLANAQGCAGVIKAHLTYQPNNTRFFGNQLIMDGQDNVIGQEQGLLLQATDFSVESLFSLVRSFGGVPVPAHIDRDSHSILTSLGFINPDLQTTCVELSKNAGDFSDFDPQLRVITSSDAHQLGDIFEQVQAYDLKDCSAEGFLKYIGHMI